MLPDSHSPIEPDVSTNAGSAGDWGGRVTQEAPLPCVGRGSTCLRGRLSGLMKLFQLMCSCIWLSIREMVVVKRVGRNEIPTKKDVIVDLYKQIP